MLKIVAKSRAIGTQAFVIWPSSMGNPKQLSSIPTDDVAILRFLRDYDAGEALLGGRNDS
jgi:hypothetical protein